LQPKTPQKPSQAISMQENY